MQERGNRIIDELRRVFNVKMETEEIQKVFDQFDAYRKMVVRCEFGDEEFTEEEILDIGEEFYNSIKKSFIF